METMLSRPWAPWGKPTLRQNMESPIYDAAGRIRVSSPETVFDSKLATGKLEAYWHELLIGSATAPHDDVNACIDLAVSQDGDVAINQTWQRWNYQPDKSQRIVCTCRFSTAPGISMAVGPCHGDYSSPHEIHDGLFFRMTDGVMSVNVYKGTQSTGIVREVSVPQSEWNRDRLDGTGKSGVVADWDTVQRVTIDFLWHGTGSVRFWVDAEGTSVLVHEELHANRLYNVYMSNATQPIRYEIRSTGGAGTFKHICASVSSEGGITKTGVNATLDTDGVYVPCPTNTVTMLIAFRLKLDTPESQVLIQKTYTLNSANNNYRWVLLYNPVIVGTPNWTPLPSTPLEVWRNSGASPVTMGGGIPLDSGYASRDARASNTDADPTLSVGIGVDGSQIIVGLGIEGLDGATSCVGGIGVRLLV